MKMTIIIAVVYIAVSISAFADITGKIVFTSDRNGNADVYIANADGSGEKQLTKDDASDDQPVLSPDGASVVFISGRKGNNDVWLVKSGGGGEKQLTKTDEDEYDPAFTNDGGSVIFTRVVNGANKIISKNIGSGEEKELASGYMGRVDSDGTLVYVSAESGDEELYVGSKNLTDSEKSDTWPSYSPDGSKIIFTSRRGGDYDTYIMNRDGSNCKALLSSEDDEGRAAISPDGNYIAVSVEEGADYEILIYDINGEFVNKLTDNEDADYEPHWGK